MAMVKAEDIPVFACMAGIRSSLDGPQVETQLGAV